MVDADTAHTQGKSVCQYGMDGSECNGPELEADNGGLAANAADAVGQWHWKDVELELPHGQVSSGHAEVEVALRGAMKQTVTIVETRTDDGHCDRFGSIKCETWTDVAQCADMRVAGTDDAGYMPVQRKCLVEFNTKKLNGVRKLEAGASHLNTSGSVRTSQSGCCSE